jgi:hypothetical protein
MKKSELKQIIKEEIENVLNEETFTAFGGVHSDEQLSGLEKQLNLYKSKDPKIWTQYIDSLKRKGYDNPTHKEHPHYKWAIKKLSNLT